MTIHLPLDRRDRDHCGKRSPRGHYVCNRRPGHTGRCMFYRRHIDGKVRAVWEGA